MTEQRRSAPRTPEQHLHAEIATFPLVTEAAFRSALTHLDPALGTGTGLLWRACEARVAEHTNWSLDRVVGIRDQTWFGVDHMRRGEPATRVPMHVYLRSLARSILAPEPGLTRTITDFEQSRLDAESRHHWMVFAMPEDLLLSGLRVDPAPERVVSDAGLLERRLLDSGVAEVHQHLGAGMNFPLLWASALATLALPGVHENLFAGPATPLAEGRDLTRWLLAAAITRCLLGEMLVNWARGSAAPSLSDFVASLARGRLSSRQHRILHACLVALEFAEEARLPDFLDMRDLYAELHPSVQDLDARPLRDISDAFFRCDPLASRLGLRGFNAGERWLQGRSADYLESHEDRLFAVLWWQVVRIRCIYYRAIVERPQNTGLQWFVRFYERIEKLRKALDPVLVAASFATAGGGQPIAALEVRKGIEPSPLEIAQSQLEMLRGWTRVSAEVGGQGRVPEFGVIYHFVKVRDVDGGWARGTPPAFWSGTHAEPNAGRVRGVLPRERYLEFLQRQARITRALGEVIERVPSLLWLLRGIDTARDELGVPTWVFVPMFAHLKRVSEIASCRRGAGPPLGVTAHVGEDFRHLLEGMRRIYEQVHYVLGPAGGRLGHAVALGLDPALWAESSRVVVMPAEERLWDLVVEWRLHTQYRVPSEFATQPPPGRIEQLHNLVLELSEHVFAKAHEPQHLAEAHHALHGFLLPAPGEPWASIEGEVDVFGRGLARLERRTDVPFVKRVVAILRHYLCDEATFRRGQTPIEVVTSELELLALQAVQAGLRRGIGRRGIVVEVNPSSNLLIGDLVDLRNHPILRLSPPERSASDLPPVAIAIGSDDPVTFSTSLLHEYVLLHQAARAAGYGERVVQTWLDEIRQTGMDARMTVAWRPTLSDQATKIADDLSRYASLPRTLSGLTARSR